MSSARQRTRPSVVCRSLLVAPSSCDSTAIATALPTNAFHPSSDSITMRLRRTQSEAMDASRRMHTGRWAILRMHPSKLRLLASSQAIPHRTPLLTG